VAYVREERARLTPLTRVAVALAFLHFLAASPSVARAGLPAGEGGAVWDLLALVRGDPNPPAERTIGSRAAYGETRTVVAVPVPHRIAYPVKIPPAAILDFGYALSPGRDPSQVEPTRFQVVLADRAGGEHVLLDRLIDIGERRWFDARIDLTTVGDSEGMLSFSATPARKPDGRSKAQALFSAPRILRRAEADGPSILLITIDCLRADHVSAYGYPLPTTPRLDRLATESIRFEHAYASGPSTMPALPQLFTSSVFPVPHHESLLTGIVGAGIPSAAIVNNPWLTLWLSNVENRRPADVFDLLVSGDQSAAAITDRALAWLEGRAQERVALYLHYLDAHTPYHPQPAYERMFLRRLDRPGASPFYDANIRYIDDQIGRLLDVLRRDGWLERTVIVVTADHGEEFHDHGRYGHGHSLYDELLHVPLIVRLPGPARTGTVVKRQVRSIDLAPSLLGWAGIPVPASFEGRRLDEAIAHPEEPGPDLLAAIPGPRKPPRYALRTLRYKLIDQVDSGRFELYDLLQDPHELRDVFTVESAVATDLTQRLASSRAVLARTGYHVRVVGTGAQARPFRLRLVVSGQGAGAFATIDRTPGPRDTTIDIADDGQTLVFAGLTDSRGRGLRFDLAAGPGGGRNDRFDITLAADGEPGPVDRVRLGAAGRAPPVGGIDVRDAALTANAAPECSPPAEGVGACFWNYPGALASPTPSVPDAATRDRLRALGYVQ
jgi:hypothetical protein